MNFETQRDQQPDNEIIDYPENDQVPQNQVPQNQVRHNQVPHNQVPHNQVPEAQVPETQEYIEDYDPHLYRTVAKPTTNFETLAHLLKSSIGTGILAMPQGYVRAGLVTGVIATVIVGILMTYCLHLIIRSQYEMCKRQRVPVLTYQQTMAACLSQGPRALRPASRASIIVVDVFLIVYQLGICCVYIVFIAENIKAIVDPYYVMGVEIHMLIILGPLIAFNCIPNLKVLAPFSAFANVITFIGLGIVIYYLFVIEKSKKPVDLWGSVVTFPLFFGTVLFALTAVGVVVALETNMKTPKAFVHPYGVLNMGMGFIVVLYTGLGVLGYLTCRSDSRDSITLNMPQDEALAKSLKGLFSVAIFISYGLQCYVPVEIFWAYLSKRLQRSGSTHMRIWEYAMRMTLCVATFLLAISVPKLGLFISLFGALCLSALAILFPAVMDLCVQHSVKGPRGTLIKVRNGIIIVVGIVGFFAGTYTALHAIVISFTE